METTSIKALAIKALQGNRQGTQKETPSFHARKMGAPILYGGNSPKQMGISDKPLVVFIYSRLLEDRITLVRTQAQAEELRRLGSRDVIYTADEVQALKGKTPEEVKAVHAIKAAFFSGRLLSETEGPSV